MGWLERLLDACDYHEWLAICLSISVSVSLYEISRALTAPSVRYIDNTDIYIYMLIYYIYIEYISTGTVHFNPASRTPLASTAPLAGEDVAPVPSQAWSALIFHDFSR